MQTGIPGNYGRYIGYILPNLLLSASEGSVVYNLTNRSTSYFLNDLFSYNLLLRIEKYIYCQLKSYIFIKSSSFLRDLNSLKNGRDHPALLNAVDNLFTISAQGVRWDMINIFFVTQNSVRWEQGVVL